MRAQPIRAGFFRIGAAVRSYLTTRWWMPLVLYCVGVAGLFVAIMQTLKLANAIE
jgi:hypothetical protein